MPPKKRDKPCDKESSTDQMKTDRELFLQAFESNLFFPVNVDFCNNNEFLILDINSGLNAQQTF